MAEDDAAKPKEPDTLVSGAILHASTVSGRFENKVFVIGPFATRLNFYRQQNRALNLVWALGQDKAFRNQKVAVIGAGLAGVTAAAALLGIGCSVTIYETDQPIMPRQRATSHRFAHPNLNYWPDETLNPSTNFPFFNWMAADCVDISEDLRDDWNDFAQLLRPYPSAKVVALSRQDDRIFVETEKKEHQTDFAYVVLATGFGPEGKIDKILARDYWRNDDFRPPKKDEEAIFVSGAGDGGLIDALRLSHNKFAAGRLIVEIAEKLYFGATGQTIRETEQKIYDDALRRYEKLRATKPNHLLKDSLDDGEAVLARQSLYTEQIRTVLAPDLLARLGDSLSERIPSVFLVSPLEAPYSCYAAPIHKLLLAHAIHERRIKHIPGRIGIVDGDPTINPAPVGIVFNPNRTILRHGAEFELGLLDPTERAEIKIRQGAYIDKLDIQIWNKEVIRDLRFGLAEQDRAVFVKAHLRRADRLTDLHPAILISYQEGEELFHYQVIRPRIELGRRPPPETIFGLPLIERKQTPRGRVEN